MDGDYEDEEGDDDDDDAYYTTASRIVAHLSYLWLVMMIMMI